MGCEARRWNALLVASGNIHGEQRRPAIATGIAEEHQDATVRREGRSFVVESGGENPLARAVRLHDADGKLSAALFGEGDVLHTRRPHRAPQPTPSPLLLVTRTPLPTPPSSTS